MTKQLIHRLLFTVLLAASSGMAIAACGSQAEIDPDSDLAPEAAAGTAAKPLAGEEGAASEDDGVDGAAEEVPAVVEAGLGCAAFENSERFLPVADLIASMEDPTCEAGQSVVFIDARPQLDYEFGHIPDAINVPYFNVEAYADELSKDDWLIVYCECPHAEAVQAADALTGKFGFTKVKVIDEGLGGWTDLGRPLVTKSAESESEG